METSTILIKDEILILKEEPKVGWEKQILGPYIYSKNVAELLITNYRLAIVSPDEKMDFWKELISEIALNALEEILNTKIPMYKYSKAPSCLINIPLQAIQAVMIKRHTMFIIPTTEISLLFFTKDGRRCISFYWDYGFTTNANEFILNIGNKILEACIISGANINSIDEYYHLIKWN